MAFYKSLYFVMEDTLKFIKNKVLLQPKTRTNNNQIYEQSYI